MAAIGENLTLQRNTNFHSNDIKGKSEEDIDQNASVQESEFETIYIKEEHDIVDQTAGELQSIATNKLKESFESKERVLDMANLGTVELENNFDPEIATTGKLFRRNSTNDCQFLCEHNYACLNQAEHKDEVESWECAYPSCGIFLKTLDELSEHFKIHSFEMPFTREQTGCSKSFRNERNFNIHTKAHGVVKSFKCDQLGCVKSFDNIRKLRYHKRMHMGDKPFKCKQTSCQEAFMIQSALNSHMRSHSKDRPFKCEQIGCTKSFKTMGEMKAHIRRHSDGRPYICTQIDCTKAFKIKCDLNKHLRVHNSNKTFKCNHNGCSKWFKSKGELNMHIGLHGSDNPIKSEQIPSEKTSRRRSKNNTHMRKSGGCTKSRKSWDQLNSPLPKDTFLNEENEPLENDKSSNVDSKSDDKGQIEINHVTAEVKLECDHLEYSEFKYVEAGRIEKNHVAIDVKLECDDTE